MKIFLSWSGERSRLMAVALRTWLRQVLQCSQPFMSEHDLEAGINWGRRIAEELRDTTFGVLCLTPENLERPWVLFEAGALSKTIERCHVCPFVLDIEPHQVPLPLGQFHGVKADKNGTRKLVLTMHAIALQQHRTNLTIEEVSTAFDLHWQQLADQLKEIPPQRRLAETTSMAESKTRGRRFVPWNVYW